MCSVLFITYKTPSLPLLYYIHKICIEKDSFKFTDQIILFGSLKMANIQNICCNQNHLYTNEILFSKIERKQFTFSKKQ